MPFAHTPNNRLYYEVTGPEQGDPLVLIHGAGAQLIAWHPGFIEELTRAGFRVVLFDNRDVGLSDRCEGERAEYQIEDMADDVAGLMDHLGLAAAHIAGQSLGGVIAQQFAINHPQRTLSLGIFYSAHRFEFALQDEEIIRHLSAPPAPDREGRIAQYIAGERLSGLDDVSDIEIQALAERVVDRGWDPAGVRRQGEALARTTPRPERLRELQMPVAVLHGRNDRLVSFEAALEMGRLIPGAEVHVLPEMSHQVRPSYWADFLRSLRRNVERSHRSPL